MNLLSSGIVRCLMRVGNLASKYHMNKEALVLQEAVKCARPESEIPYIGLGLTHINMGSFEEAIVVLRDHALRLAPNNATATAFLGLALKLNGQVSEAEMLLNSVIAAQEDPVAVDVAKTALAQLKSAVNH